MFVLSVYYFLLGLYSVSMMCALCLYSVCFVLVISLYYVRGTALRAYNMFVLRLYYACNKCVLRLY